MIRGVKVRNIRSFQSELYQNSSRNRREVKRDTVVPVHFVVVELIRGFLAHFLTTLLQVLGASDMFFEFRAILRVVFRVYLFTDVTDVSGAGVGVVPRGTFLTIRTDSSRAMTCPVSGGG
jgi:hypothetical protein